ncbi:MAG: DNA-binding response regulator, partial [Solirubrobacteraceae bacterium]
MADDLTSTVCGDEQLIARAGHLLGGAREEFACAARDLATWSRPQARLEAENRLRAGFPPTSTVRKLLTPAALADAEQRTELRRLAALGARVRISSAPLPHETIIIDRRVVILAGKESPLGREYTVTA